MNGKGSETTADGAHYIGDFVDGAKTGQGTMNWADSSCY